MGWALIVTLIVLSNLSYLSGLSGSFTTVKIDHLRSLELKDPSNARLYEILIGTFEDYAPMVVAVLGGLLQSLFGPKKILIASAVPGFLSWLLLIINPDSIILLLSSRLLAGLSNGLLTVSVYMPDIAPKESVPSLKQIEVGFSFQPASFYYYFQAASRSLGAMLTFVISLVFYRFGFRFVAIASAALPCVGLVGVLFIQESPEYEERY